MIYTNKLNLPKQFEKLDDEHKPIDKVFSVTELLKPSKEILLTRKYYDDIKIDIADIIPALFGTAVHNIMEQRVPDDYLAEQSVYAIFDIFGELYKIKGRCDLLSLKQQVIEDYKTCTTSKKDFEEWRLQGLMYAYLTFKTFNVIIRKLKFYALLKDWSKIKAATSSNYPQSPIFIWEYEISDSDYDFIESFMRDKLIEIINGGKSCTDEDCWYTGTQYAVYKNANDKKATYVTDDETDAHNYITNKCGGMGEIQVRKGNYIKCMYYCACNRFCEQYKERL